MRKKVLLHLSLALFHYTDQLSSKYKNEQISSPHQSIDFDFRNGLPLYHPHICCCEGSQLKTAKMKKAKEFKMKGKTNKSIIK